MADRRVTRRQSVVGLAATVAAGACALAAQTPLTPTGAGDRRLPRLVPRTDLVSALEFEEQARRVLSAVEYARIAGSPRDQFDRMTLHPRLMVPALDLDLSVTLFGDTQFAPIIVAPIGRQQRIHPDGELATVRGASAAGAVVVISSQSDVPLSRLTEEAKTPLWYQVFASDDDAPSRAVQAAEAGCRAVCVTIGTRHLRDGSRVDRTSARRDWRGVTAVRKAAGAVPVVVKGITSSESALEALHHDVQGLVVSNYGGLAGGDRDALILRLPSIADRVAGRIPILTDGSYQRGTDIVKALALGARAVMVGRPVTWGLAAYGQDGVQTVLELMQTELARAMAMSGRPNLRSIDSTLVRVHAPARPSKAVHRE